MESKAEKAVGTKKSFTDETNGSCSSAPSRDRAARLSVKTWQRTEIVVLCIVVVIIWALLSLPIVFYYIPEGSRQVTEELDMCSPDVYMRDVCGDALQSQQDCLPDRLGSDDIFISLRSGGNQEDLEMQARFLLNGLSFIGVSPECEKAALPFLCLYLFRLCDSNGTLYQPSSMDCVTISTNVCKREWTEATNLLGQEALPQCESLPVTTLSCDNVTLDAENATSDTESIISDSSSRAERNCSMESLECRDGFYINTALCACLPRCDTWEQYPHSTTVAVDVFVVLSAAIGLIGGIAVLVISCIRRKRMFRFPSVLNVYLTITIIVLDSVMLVSYTDRSDLFCSSMDLQQNLVNSTSFCIFAGIVFYYVVLQVTLWWFFHVSSLFWKMKFPLHAIAAESARQIKYVHLTMVVLGLILPLVPVIATLTTSGFGINRFPPILCFGANLNATFYTTIFPIMLFLQVGITLLVVSFWTVHKQQGLFRMRQSRSPLQIQTAEKMILVIFCYYVILGVFSLTTFTLSIKNQRVVEEISGYFTCELPGVDPQNPCDPSHYQALLHPELECLTYVLLQIFPVINLIFAVNIEDLKQWCGRVCQFHRPFITTASASTAVSTV